MALLLSLTAFWMDYRDRVEERRVQAWQLLLASAPGNSGKREALEYLNKEVGLFWITLKPRAELVGIKLGAYEGKENQASGVGASICEGFNCPLQTYTVQN